MHTARIAIVGAGLSGLYAAWLLHRRGIRDYVVLEARDAVGGRIASFTPSPQATGAGAIDRFDLGPTWFWPGYQRELHELVTALGLEPFEQFETGDMLVERSPDAPPTRTHGYANAPPSMRLVGGMGALVEALRSAVDPANVITGQTVRRLRSADPHVELDSEDAAGAVTTWRVEHVLLALPPRLAEDRIQFIPALPPDLSRQWRATPTWMAAHAKYTASTTTPRFGASRACPARPAAQAVRWSRSTTPPCPAAARRCSASSACRRRCAAASPKTCC
jgi:monoamine oxidase